MTKLLKKQTKPVVLIMAGGKGERFWPRSRNSNPKQLQKVYSNKTLLDETIDRALKVTSLDRIFIGCNAELKKVTLKSHKRLKPSQFVVEPEGKNTAPIVALAAIIFEKKFPGSIHIVLSADHYIYTLDGFKKTIQTAIEVARSGWLVTIGVPPNRPETGYGYIQTGKKIDSLKACKITSFKEKPNIKTAKQYLDNKGSYLWNSGIFIWEGKRIVEEFDLHAPKIIDLVRKGQASKSELAQAFSIIPADPVDTAIMEKTKKLAVVKAGFIWDDVGSWTSLERISNNDKSGNAYFTNHKKSSLAVHSSKNNIVVSSKPLVALLGMEDTIVVEEDDVLFIAKRNHLDDIKKFMQEMKSKAALQKFFR